MPSLVRDFHIKFGQPHPPCPPLLPDPDLIRLRMRLVREEYEETRAELEALLRCKDPDEAVALYRKLLKELCDMRYTVEGTAVSLGLPMDDAYLEVHRSNMTKDAAPGGGKAVKGPRYEPADVDQFIPSIITMKEG